MTGTAKPSTRPSSTICRNARLRLLPDSGTAVVMLTKGGPREHFYRTVFNEILTDVGTATNPDLPTPDPALSVDLARYEGVYERPCTRFDVRPTRERCT